MAKKEKDATGATGANNKQGNVPRKEADLITASTNVKAAWDKRPGLTLQWTTPVQFGQTITTFEQSFAERNKVKGARPAITLMLGTVNSEIDKSAEHVKNYISETYSKKEAPAHYGRFGIVKENNKFRLPGDNDKRLHALDMMIEAIVQDGLADRKYGETYWRNLKTRFAEAKSLAYTGDSASAEHVGIKTEQKEVILQTLRSLILIIKGNYPKSWKEELRVWGFQKEKY